MDGGTVKYLVVRANGSDEWVERTLVVPALNEEIRLPALLESLGDHLDPSSTEVLVVDDGSTDRTAEVAREGLTGFPLGRVLRHGHNAGKGAAVRTGVAEARGRIIGFVDADNATDLSALMPMSDRCTGRVGAVFGSRHTPSSDVKGAPALRGVMGRAFNHLVRFAAGTGVRDTQCGAKVFQAPVARVVFSSTSIDGYAFDVEILRRVLALGLEVVEHPVRWRHVPGSRIGVLTPIRMFFDIVRLRRGAVLPLLTTIDVDAADWEAAQLALRTSDLEADELLDAELDDAKVIRLIVPDGIAPRAVEEALDRAAVNRRLDHTRSWFHLSGRSAS